MQLKQGIPGREMQEWISRERVEGNMESIAHEQ
jgi:hypothetical protein